MISDSHSKRGVGTGGRSVHNEQMVRTVALTPDIFNISTEETCYYNEAELRNFYSLETLDSILTDAGFKSEGRRLCRAGDPPLNALTAYRKV